MTSTACAIKLPTAQLYPRLCLFGVAQELRDLIYDQVFHSGDTAAELQGAKHLQPLLVCRQLYHEAQEMAWKNASFEFPSDLIELKKSPPQITTRKVKCIRVYRSNVRSLIEFQHLLPCMQTLHISGIGRPGNTDAKPRECTWFWNMLDCGHMRSRADRFEMPPAAFEPEIMRLAASFNSLRTSPPEAQALIRHKQAEGSIPQHFVLSSEPGLEWRVYQSESAD